MEEKNKQELIRLNRNLLEKCKKVDDTITIEQKKRYDAIDYMSLMKAIEEIKDARRLLNITSKPSIMDVGAGEGFAREILIRSFGKKYVGIDILPELESIYENNVWNIALEDVKTKWDTAEYDILFCFHVLEHSLDISNTIEHLKKLLSPKGLILHVTPYVMEDEEEAHTSVLNLESWLYEYAKEGLVPLSIKFHRFFGLELHMVMCKIEDRPCK